jgi:hypothetical protein
MRVARGIDVLREVADSPRFGRPSALRDRLRREALELARAEELVDAAYSYRIVALEAPAAPRLRAGGETLHAPRLLPESGQLTALACAVCTLGTRLEQRVTSLFAERRASLALALDELGNELLFAASRRVQDRMLVDAARRGLSVAGELRAGDPGLALAEQATVLRLAQAGLIGVHVSDDQLMQPLKSVSMVMGVGLDLPPAQWSRCDDCPRREKCKLVARVSDTAMHH